MNLLSEPPFIRWFFFKNLPMKILDLPTEQIKWLLLQINNIELEALKKGYLETVSLLDEGKIIGNLLHD